MTTTQPTEDQGRRWIVNAGDGPGPRFRDSGKKWFNGDIITEADLLKIYQRTHIETLVADGSLRDIAGSQNLEEPTDEEAKRDYSWWASIVRDDCQDDPDDPKPRKRPSRRAKTVAVS